MTSAFKNAGKTAWQLEIDPDEHLWELRRLSGTTALSNANIDDFWEGYRDAREASQAADWRAA